METYLWTRVIVYNVCNWQYFLCPYLSFLFPSFFHLSHYFLPLIPHCYPFFSSPHIKEPLWLSVTELKSYCNIVLENLGVQDHFNLSTLLPEAPRALKKYRIWTLIPTPAIFTNIHKKSVFLMNRCFIYQVA